MEKDTKYIIGIGAGAALLYFGVLNPLLTAFGLKQKEESKKLDLQSASPDSPWSMNFYKGFPGAVLLRMSIAEQYARTIYDSFGLFNDCEECAIGVFKQLQYQSQLSFLAEVFFRLYQEDLLSFVRGGNWPQDRLSDMDVSAINDYINKLPVK